MQLSKSIWVAGEETGVGGGSKASAKRNTAAVAVVGDILAQPLAQLASQVTSLLGQL
jgi:hypothetical protein